MCHHQLSVLSVIVTALLACVATPLAPHWHDKRVKHAWDAVPANWESLGPPPPNAAIDLHVALKPHNPNALIDALYEVSSPGQPKYGAHLSKEEVARLVAPHPHTLELVHSWLLHHDIPLSSISTTHGGGWLTVTGVPVSQANELLGASYQLYRDTGMNDSRIIRTVGYALPTVLHKLVHTVVPTTFFASTGTPQQTPRRSSVRAAAALAKVGLKEPVTVLSGRHEFLVTPEIVRWLYGTITYVPAMPGRNTIGIVGYLNDKFASETDLAAFMKLYRAEAEDATFTVELVNGGNYDENNPGVKENLVMQYPQAIAYPTSVIQYSLGGRLRWSQPSNEPAPGDAMLSWLNYMLAQDDIPETISIFYGHDEKIVPRQYARTLCDLFALLGARGVSVLFATGNNGVGSGDCMATDGSGIVQFKALFPASCPWVTSVGGTTGDLPEVAARISGGGFSNYFPLPDYQNDAVSIFLERLGTRYAGSFNISGRGIPDIAAQALNCQTVTADYLYTLGTTSCAAAIVTGIISLLNDFLLLHGKPPLGFLNPRLYGDGLDSITDIASGSNPGCGTDGFSAVEGWDPVTGLGTLDFPDLQDILLNSILSSTSTSMPTSTPTPIQTLFGTQTPMPTPRL